MYRPYDFDMKVKTICLTSRKPKIMDDAIKNAVPKDASVVNYIFCAIDGHYFCHILYYEKSPYGFYANGVPRGCDE